MSLWGKVVDGSIGRAMGGPIGDAIAAIGREFTHPCGESSRPVTPQPSEQDIAAAAYFVCFFSCLAKMAQADGTVTKDEILVIEQMMADMDLIHHSRTFAIKVFSEARGNQISAAEYLQQFAEIIDYDAQVGLSLIHYLYTVASADGDISQREKNFLREAEFALRLRLGTVDTLVSQRMDLDQAYLLMNCTPEMSDTDIKRAYYAQCFDHHPDRLQAKGLPPEFTQFATEQVTKIHTAYELIRQARNRDLDSCLA